MGFISIQTIRKKCVCYRGQLGKLHSLSLELLLSYYLKINVLVQNILQVYIPGL